MGRWRHAARYPCVGYSLRTLNIRWMDAMHICMRYTMDAIYTLIIRSLFVGNSSSFGLVRQKFAIETDCGREFERIWTLSNFEKEISTLGIS